MTDTARPSASKSAAPKPRKGRVATAREAVSASLESGAARARERVGDLREQATHAVESGAQAIDSAPLATLAGAIALGAVAATLLPATRRELQAIGPLGDRMKLALDEAFTAATAAGADQLTAKGLTSAALTSGLGTLVGNIVTAALAASTAAAESARTSVTTPPPRPKPARKPKA